MNTRRLGQASISPPRSRHWSNHRRRSSRDRRTPYDRDRTPPGFERKQHFQLERGGAYNRYRGPPSGRLEEISPNDSNYAHLVSYRTYRLMRRYTKRGGSAKISLTTSSTSASSSPLAVYDWPSAVNHLLRMYATDWNIKEALDDLKAVKQKSNETEEDYHNRFILLHARAGCPWKEVEQVSHYIEGLLGHTRFTMYSAQQKHRTSDLLAIVKEASWWGKTMRHAIGAARPSTRSATPPISGGSSTFGYSTWETSGKPQPNPMFATQW